MSEAARLQVVVDANIGGLQRGLTKAQAEVVAAKGKLGALDKQTAAVGATSKKSGAGMAAMAGSAKVLGGALAAGGLAGAMKSVITTTQGYTKQMAATKSVTGASAKQMAQLGEQAKTAGAKFGIGATEAAQAQTELAKGGISTAAILSGGFTSALTLAAAGELGMADAATYTVNAMKTFGIEGRNSAQVADALALAANATTADVSDFGLAMTQGGSAAKAAGLSFRETTTVLSALAEIGVKGSDAGTSMKAAFLQLLNPTDRQAAAAKRAGLAFTDQNGQMKDAVEISSMLRSKTEDMTQAQRVALFSTLAGTDGLRTLLALYDQGPTKVQKLNDALGQQGYAADVARQKQEGLHGDMARFNAELESAKISLGEGLAPGLGQAAEKLAESLRQLNEDGDLQQLGTDLGTLGSDGATALTALAQGFSNLSDNRAGVRDITSGVTDLQDALGKLTDIQATGSPILSMLGLDPASVAKSVGGIFGVENKVKELLGEVNKLNNVDLTLPIALTGADNVIQGMRDIDAIRLHDKIQKVLGKNTDAQSKVKQIQGMDIPPKLAEILGSNADAISKIGAVKAYMDSIQSKTVTIGVKVALQGSIGSVAAAARQKVKAKASGRGTGRSETALVGEGRAGEWVGNTSTGALGWVDSPTLMALGPNDFVIPTEARYRSNAARIAASVGIAGYAKGKKKRTTLEQVDPASRESTVVGDRPLNKLRPPSNSFSQVVVPSAAEIALAQAQLTRDPARVYQALQGLVGQRTAEYNAAVASGDPQRIKDAADNLMSAGDQLQSAGEAIVAAQIRRDEAAIDAGTAVGRLTGNRGLQMSAAQNAWGYWSGRYQAAWATGDYEQIRDAANALSSAAEDMKEAARGVFRDQLGALDAQYIRAQILTPDNTADDLAALQASLGVATQAYNDAFNRGDVEAQREFGNELLNLRQSIDDLQKTVDDSADREREMNDLLRQQLDEARRLAASTAASKDAVIRALTDAANRQLGGVLGQALTTPSSAGRVAVVR